MRKAIDLTSALSDLEAANDTELVKAIRKYHAVASVLVDINEVKASLAELKQAEAGSSNLSPHVAGALLVHAIVTYARASHSKPISRWMADATSAFNDDEKAMHRKIVALRDKCIAHFGFGDDWNDERVIYKLDGDQLGVTTVHRRSSHRTEIAIKLDVVANKAARHLSLIATNRASELLTVLMCSPRESLEIITVHGFEPSQYFRNMSHPVEEFWRARKGFESFFSDIPAEENDT